MKKYQRIALWKLIGAIIGLLIIPSVILCKEYVKMFLPILFYIFITFIFVFFVSAIIFQILSSKILELQLSFFLKEDEHEVYKEIANISYSEAMTVYCSIDSNDYRKEIISVKEKVEQYLENHKVLSFHYNIFIKENFALFLRE